MKIIYARPDLPYNIPSDAVMRELIRLGHKVLPLESATFLPSEQYDVVFSPYETTTILGDRIASALGVPHYAHLETIPPWRYFKECDIENYGLKPSDDEMKDFQKHKEYYEEVITCFRRATFRTAGGRVRQQYIKDVTGVDCGVRYPSIDVRTLKMLDKMFDVSRDENRIVTTSRATIPKRYDLLMEVMSKVKTKCIWTIIGVGPMIDVIHKEFNNPNVQVEFMGMLLNHSKNYWFKKSKLVLHAMGGMPLMEGAFLGCFPIGIEQQPTKHLPEFDKFMEDIYGDSVPLFKHTDLDKAAEFIDYCFSVPNEKLFEKYQTVEKFMEGKTNLTSSKKNAEQIIQVIS